MKRRVSDQARVAPALLPVLASFRRTPQHRQECLCHTIHSSLRPELFINGSRINRHPHHGVSSDSLQRLDLFERADSAGDDQAA